MACANLSRFSSEASVFSDALGILPPAPAFYLEDSWVKSAASWGPWVQTKSMVGHVKLTCFFLCPKPLPWAPAVWPVFHCPGASVPTLLPEVLDAPLLTGALKFPLQLVENGGHTPGMKRALHGVAFTPHCLPPGPCPENGQKVVTLVPPPLPPPSLLGAGSKTHEWTSLCPSVFRPTCCVCVASNPPNRFFPQTLSYLDLRP